VDGSPLVSTAWLAAHLADADVVVLDCRWYLQPFDLRRGADEYEAGHIPGARHVSWDRELADHPLAFGLVFDLLDVHCVLLSRRPKSGSRCRVQSTQTAIRAAPLARKPPQR